jgi:hypothetical protein
MAVALFSLGIRSAIVPPPSVNGAAPTLPAKNRNAMSMPMFLLNAQQMLKTTKRKLQEWYSGKRPYISDMGAMTSMFSLFSKEARMIQDLPRGPNANPST